MLKANKIPRTTMNTPIEIEATIVSRPINPYALTFADNPQPRCPVVLLLDCSSSMAGSPITELEAAVGQFYREMASDPIASMSVEIGVVTFGDSIKKLRDFEAVADTLAKPLPHLVASGNTPMGAAIRLAVDEVKQRRAFYKCQGFSAYKPWIVLMTDGQPNDDWQNPAMTARGMADRGELTFIGVGIGTSVDMTTLSQIVPPDPGAHRLAGLKFQNFFRWLADSLRLVSTGSTVQQRAMPNPAEYDWKL